MKRKTLTGVEVVVLLVLLILAIVVSGALMAAMVVLGAEAAAFATKIPALIAPDKSTIKNIIVVAPLIFLLWIFSLIKLWSLLRPTELSPLLLGLTARALRKIADKIAKEQD